MKRNRSMTARALEKIVLFLPLLILMGFVVQSYLARPVFAARGEAPVAAAEEQVKVAPEPIVPALSAGGRKFFQSFQPTPTFTPTPIPPTPTSTATSTPTPIPPTPTSTSTPTPIPPTPTPTNTPIANRPPRIDSIVVPPLAVNLDQKVEVSGSYSDPDAADSHSARWQWGDGSSTPACPPNDGSCAVDQANRFVNGSHTYDEAGVYLVTLTVTDSDGLSDSKMSQSVVVYDPSGGFITGAGWIDSPPGAYKADQTVNGIASFAFSSKYKKGGSMPKGTSIFSFSAGKFAFRSDGYQWLAINQGSNIAQFEGRGRVNGRTAPTGEPYQFMVWATDGATDTYRIRIWFETPGGEVVVYDNGTNQAIEGGAVVVHRGK